MIKSLWVTMPRITEGKTTHKYAPRKWLTEVKKVRDLRRKRQKNTTVAMKGLKENTNSYGAVKVRRDGQKERDFYLDWGWVFCAQGPPCMSGPARPHGWLHARSNTGRAKVRGSVRDRAEQKPQPQNHEETWNDMKEQNQSKWREMKKWPVVEWEGTNEGGRVFQKKKKKSKSVPKKCVVQQKTEPCRWIIPVLDLSSVGSTLMVSAV